MDAWMSSDLFSRRAALYKCTSEVNTCSHIQPINPTDSLPLRQLIMDSSCSCRSSRHRQLHASSRPPDLVSTHHSIQTDRKVNIPCPYVCLLKTYTIHVRVFYALFVYINPLTPPPSLCIPRWPYPLDISSDAILHLYFLLFGCILSKFILPTFVYTLPLCVSLLWHLFVRNPSPLSHLCEYRHSGCISPPTSTAICTRPPLYPPQLRVHPPSLCIPPVAPLCVQSLSVISPILPSITYGAPAWWPGRMRKDKEGREMKNGMEGHRKKLDKSQNVALRAIFPG